jgi:putative two-component system response regulator
MSKVLIVDDIEANLYLLESLLKGHGHEVVRAPNGILALDLARKSPPDAIISDILMPGMDGFALCREWRRDPRLQDIPFIFYTATYTDPKDEALARDLGADRFIVKPTDPAAFMDVFRKVLSNPKNLSPSAAKPPALSEDVLLEQYNQALVRKLESKLEEIHRINQALDESYEKLDRVLLQTVNALASAMTQRDAYTAQHQLNCAKLVVAIARRMGASEHEVEGIRVAALLHDIGKLAIPVEVLAKPSHLTELDWALIRNHVEVGFEIVRRIDFPWPVAEMIRQHHERLDGSGYPRGISGPKILFESRILVVADVVEAMLSHRPYRPARGLDEVLEEILQNKYKLYDGDVVEACRYLAANQALPM